MERIGVSVGKRWTLVQADIWAKRGEAGDICELDPLLKEEEARTRSAIGRLVDGLAQQGHLLVRHRKGFNCNACNVYRADRQFNIWSRTVCVPRPCAAEVISRVRKLEKTAHQRLHRQYGLRQDWFLCSFIPCDQHINAPVSSFWFGPLSPRQSGQIYRRPVSALVSAEHADHFRNLLAHFCASESVESHDVSDVASRLC